MAVQAQYPSNVLMISRGEQEAKGMDFPTAATPGHLDQSAAAAAAAFFSPANNGGGANPRKRGREAAAAAAAAMGQSQQPSMSLWPSVPPATGLVGIAGLQLAQPPPLVSTGLRLAFEDQNQSQSQSQSSPLLPCFLSEDLAALLAQQRDEIDRFVLAQGEQLRRALAERRQRHHRALLGAAEEAAARRLREKEAEVETAARRCVELEERLARLRTESMAWQAKALADQAAAATLHAQLQQAAAAAAAPSQARDECGDSPAAEDAESAHIDPDRVEPVGAAGSSGLCRACHSRHVSVVLLPCRHLCLCVDCDAAWGAACPVCRSARTGSVLVLLS